MDSLGSVLNRISTIDMNARRFGLSWTSPPEGTYQAPMAAVDGDGASAIDGTAAAAGIHVSGRIAQAAAASAAQPDSFSRTLQAAHTNAPATPKATPRVPSRSTALAETSTPHAPAKPVTQPAAAATSGTPALTPAGDAEPASRGSSCFEHSYLPRSGVWAPPRVAP